MKRRSSHPHVLGQNTLTNSTVAPQAKQNAGLAPGLYVTATPIGNARDITLRALDVLQNCDFVAAEDTRVTAKLLAIHGISKPLIPYNDHNASRQRPALIRQLRGGHRIALVSDAGTPLISDPGFKLVREVLADGIPVHTIPGASASLTALVAAGLPTNKFCFAGFLPVKRGERLRVLRELAGIPATLVFFESALRVHDSLSDMLHVLGPRAAAVGRELTKLHEEIRRGSLSELESQFESAVPRGEVTIVVGPPAARDPDFAKVDALLSRAVKRMSLSNAVEFVSEALSMPRNGVYKRALLLKSNEQY